MTSQNFSGRTYKSYRCLLLLGFIWDDMQQGSYKHKNRQSKGKKPCNQTFSSFSSALDLMYYLMYYVLVYVAKCIDAVILKLCEAVCDFICYFISCSHLSMVPVDNKLINNEQSSARYMHIYEHIRDELDKKLIIQTINSFTGHISK